MLSNAAAVLTGTAVLDKKEYISFKTYDEAQNFIESSRTKFMRYIIKHAATQRDVPLSFIPFMNDYKEPWTNERFYKYFKLTPEEIKEVENAADM